MGVFQAISATDLALQIKGDSEEAIKLINNLGLHYTASRQRFIELLSLSQADENDKEGVLYYLNMYIQLGEALVQRVQDDITGITDGSIFNTDPSGNTTPPVDDDTPPSDDGSSANTDTSDTSNTASANTP